MLGALPTWTSKARAAVLGVTVERLTLAQIAAGIDRFDQLLCACRGGITSITGIYAATCWEVESGIVLWSNIKLNCSDIMIER